MYCILWYIPVPFISWYEVINYVASWIIKVIIVNTIVSQAITHASFYLHDNFSLILVTWQFLSSISFTFVDSASCLRTFNNSCDPTRDWTKQLDHRYHTLLKKKNAPFLNEDFAKGAFLTKVRPSIYSSSTCGNVKQEALKEQYVAKGGTNNWRHNCISKHMTQTCIYLISSPVCVFSEDYGSTA